MSAYQPPPSQGFSFGSRGAPPSGLGAPSSFSESKMNEKPPGDAPPPSWTKQDKELWLEGVSDLSLSSDPTLLFHKHIDASSFIPGADPSDTTSSSPSFLASSSSSSSSIKKGRARAEDGTASKELSSDFDILLRTEDVSGQDALKRVAQALSAPLFEMDSSSAPVSYAALADKRSRTIRALHAFLKESQEHTRSSTSSSSSSSSSSYLGASFGSSTSSSSGSWGSVDSNGRHGSATGSVSKTNAVTRLTVGTLFPMLTYLAKSEPSLCGFVTQSLLSVLETLPPLSLKDESFDVVSAFRTLFASVLPEGDHINSDEAAAALSAVVMLSTQCGSLSQVLRAVATLNRTRSSDSPLRVGSLLRHVLLLNNGLQVPYMSRISFDEEWRHNSLTVGTKVARIPPVEKHALHFVSRSGKQSYHTGGVAVVGSFLFVYNKYGVAKVGTGLDGTVKGRVYASNTTVVPVNDSDRGGLVCVHGRLYLARSSYFDRKNKSKSVER